jgi:phosphoglycerol transferase MdoB-like AlkP superfamily enzyme
MNLVQWKISKSLQWLVRIFLLYLLMFTAFRVITLMLFKPAELPIRECIKSFALGVSYDLRWIAFIFLPSALLNLFPRTSPFYSDTTKRNWILYFAIITLILLFLYGADFGQFAYVRARLNADALNFFEDPKEMWEMVSSSYPIFWILLALVGAVILFYRIFKRMHGIVENKNENIHKFHYLRAWNYVFFLILLLFIRGAFTQRTLRFDRAFTIKNNFAANLALNPMQNFFTTLRFRKPDKNSDAQKYYAEVKKYLGIDSLNRAIGNPYARLSAPSSTSVESQPNVVLVICESFSMYKSSMSGNPLNATPYFSNLSKQGLFFDRCYSPHFSTARGVYAIITGIPDVQMSKFSSRNEEAVSNATIVNEFKDYNKMYFIGGNSEFNNFKGVLNNINDVRIYEEKDFKSPRVNVWGISDKDLFKEANKVLANQQKPFFAVLQTADNHRPLDLYQKDPNFKPRNVAKENLQQYGFDDLDEFNTFCYSDYCFQNFMDSAKKEAYFNNTIFIFVGDHGVEGNASGLYPKAWTEQRLSEEHIPLLFYAPALIKPQMRHDVVSQIDILPTAATLAGITYKNSSLGRDITKPQQDASAFIIYHAPGWIGVVNNQYFYRYNIRSKVEELVSVTDNVDMNTLPNAKLIKDSARQKSLAIYETAKWMLLNN